MAKIGEADIEVEADLKKFQKDLEKIKKQLEKLDARVIVTPKLATGSRRLLQEQLDKIRNLKVEITPVITRKSLQESLNKIAGQATKPKIGVDVQFSRAQLLAALKAVSLPRPSIKVDLNVQGGAGLIDALNRINQTLSDGNSEREFTNRLLALQLHQGRGNLNNLRQQSIILRDIHGQYASFIPFIQQQRQGLRDTNNNARRLLANILGINRIRDPFPVIVGSALASELLLSSLARVFKAALNFRRIMVQVGAATAVAFAAGAQAVGAAAIGIANLITGLQVAAGLGIIAIGVKLQIANNAEVAASVENLKSTFNEVFTEASKSLAPVITEFNNELSSGLRSQQAAFTGFFNTVAPGLQKLGKAFNTFLQSEQFTRLIGSLGTATNNFLEGFAARLPGIINGIERIGKKFGEIKPRLQAALGPGIFSGLSVDKVVAGLEKMTQVIEQAGPGIRAFKEAFGVVFREVGRQIDLMSKTIGEFGPRLFGNLGKLGETAVAAIGEVGRAAVEAADTVLNIAGPAVNTFIKTLGKELANFTRILAEPLGHVLKRVSELGTKLAPLLTIFAELSAALEPVIDPIFDFLDVVAELAVKIGTALVPVVKGFATVLGPVISALAFVGRIILNIIGPALDYIADHPWIGILIGGALAILAPMKTLGVVLGVVGKALKFLGLAKLGGFFTKLAAGAARLGGILSGAFSKIGPILARILPIIGRIGGLLLRFAGPIGIVIGVVIALVQSFDQVKAIVMSVVNTAISLFNRLKALLSGIGEGIKQIFSGDIFGGLKTIGSSILNFIIGVGQDLFNNLKTLFTNLYQIVLNFFTSIPIIGPLIGKIAGFFRDLVGNIIGIIGGVWTFIKNAFSTGVSFIKAILAPFAAFFSSVFSGIGTIIGGVWDFIKSVFSAGVAFIGSIISGIVQFFSNPIEGIKTIISGLWSFISSVFSAGVSLIGSILSGIGSFFSAAFSAVSGIVSGVFNTVQSIIGGVVSFIGDKVSGIGRFFSTAFNVVKTVVGGAIDFVKGLIDGLLSSLASVATKVKDFFSFGGDEEAKAPAPKVDQEAINAAADQVRKQSEAILLALRELGPKVQAELANVTAIISAAFVTLGTTVGTAVTNIATQVGLGLATLGTTLTATMLTLTTTLLTQITTLATSATTTLTTTLTTATATLGTSFLAAGASMTAAFTTIFASLGVQATSFFTATLPATVLGGVDALQSNLTSGLTSAFTAAFASIGPIVAAGVAAAFASGASAAQAGMAQITAAVSAGVPQISAAFAPLEADLPAVIQRAMAKAVSTAKQGAADLVAAISKAASDIDALGGRFYQSGYNIGARLAAGIRAATEAEVRPAAAAMAQAVADNTPSSPAKEGPLSGKGDLIPRGREIVNRLVAGMREQIPVLRKAIQDVVSQFQTEQARFQANFDPSRMPNFTFPQSRGINVGVGNAGAVGGNLTGRANPNIGGRILKSDTSASIGNGTASTQVQIRPGNINVSLEGIDNPRDFFNALSRELLTLTMGR